MRASSLEVSLNTRGTSQGFLNTIFLCSGRPAVYWFNRKWRVQYGNTNGTGVSRSYVNGQYSLLHTTLRITQHSDPTKDHTTDYADYSNPKHTAYQARQRRRSASLRG
jgi:hypothetical protein